MKNHFDKNLVMFVEDETSFKPNLNCWICNKLFASENIKVRNSCNRKIWRFCYVEL